MDANLHVLMCSGENLHFFPSTFSTGCLLTFLIMRDSLLKLKMRQNNNTDKKITEIFFYSFKAPKHGKLYAGLHEYLHQWCSIGIGLSCHTAPLS